MSCSWISWERAQEIERELQYKIRSILDRIIKGSFHGVKFLKVDSEWEIDRRRADIVLWGPSTNDIFLIIETKRKIGDKPSTAQVTDRGYIGQAISYAALAIRRGFNVYFVAVCNPDAIAIYRVPDNITDIVNWDAIRRRDYENVIPLEYYPYFLDPNKYGGFTFKLELKEEFFQWLLDSLVDVWRRVKKPTDIQPIDQKVIHELRNFVSWLSWKIEPLVNKKFDKICKKYRGQISKLGRKLDPQLLARQMAYVLMNKILFYKVLERYHGDNLPKLTPLYGKQIEIDCEVIIVNSSTDYLRALNSFFKKAVKVTGDFEPIFVTGIFDEIPLPDDPEVLRGIDSFIEYIDQISIEKLGDVIGYIYEQLIPPRERHVFGEFYTPPAVCELITRWCIRSPDDVCLGPGCGSGTFEIYGYMRLYELKTGKKYGEGGYPPREIHEKILSQIYAIDIDEFAAHLTAMNLAMRNPRAPSTKMNIIVADFFTLKPCEETVLPYEKRVHIPKVDVVWGNPPYTRWLEIPESTRREILRVLDNEIEKYDLSPDPRRGKEPGIYVHWIMHATKFLKEGGRLGMIISNMWLQTDYGVNFGNFLLDHYKIKALIDISYRLFEALISTVIILAEKCSNNDERDNNEVLLIHVPTRLEPEKLSEVLSKIGDYLEGKTTTLPPGIIVNKIRQGDIPRDKNKKWISLFFPKVEDIVKILEQHPLMIRASEWFEPSRGNSVWSIWALRHGKRPDISPKDFFYFSPSKARQWNIPREYLVSAITSARFVETFTFTNEDWKILANEDKDVYILICHKPRSDLPNNVRRYVEWGEPVCPICGARFTSTQIDAQGYFTCINGHKIPGNSKCITRVRRTRGGGRAGGRIACEAEACKARREHGYPPFYDWYDLGGYIPTPIMAIYQAYYHPQFFLCTIPVVTYHAIITFIPKVKIKTSFMEYNPENYKEYLPEVKTGVELDEIEIKALLAYLNSTFNWLWVEQVGRRTGGGIIALEVQHARNMPILNVKAIDRKDVEELAKLFDELETKARKIIRTVSRSRRRRSEESEEEIGGPKLEMVRQLRDVFRKIDVKVAQILNIDIDVDMLWEYAWQMMERRVKGAKEVTRPGATTSPSSITSSKTSENVRKTQTLDEYLQ